MKFRDFPNFPRFRTWGATSPQLLDRFLVQLRDYLIKQPRTTIVEVLWENGITPTKTLTSQVKPIGVVPIAFEIKTATGYESAALTAPVQWVWSTPDSVPTLSFPTLAALTGSYRLTVQILEAV